MNIFGTYLLYSQYEDSTPQIFLILLHLNFETINVTRSFIALCFAFERRLHPLDEVHELSLT